MKFLLVLLYVLAFGVGPGLFVHGVVLLLRYRRLRSHGKRAAADVKSVTTINQGADVDVVWVNSDGDRREETIRMISVLFRTKIGKKLEIYYDDNHAVAANQKPYVTYLMGGIIATALVILIVIFHF